VPTTKVCRSWVEPPIPCAFPASYRDGRNERHRRQPRACACLELLDHLAPVAVLIQETPSVFPWPMPADGGKAARGPLMLILRSASRARRGRTPMLESEGCSGSAWCRRSQRFAVLVEEEAGVRSAGLRSDRGQSVEPDVASLAPGGEPGGCRPCSARLLVARPDFVCSSILRGYVTSRLPPKKRLPTQTAMGLTVLQIHVARNRVGRWSRAAVIRVVCRWEHHRPGPADHAGRAGQRASTGVPNEPAETG